LSDHPSFVGPFISRINPPTVNYFVNNKTPLSPK
jgi:hypothetical protein